MQKIAEWAHQWKMSFNPDLNEQAQEVVFSGKITKSSHPQIFFNSIPVSCVSFQKHLGIYLDEKLNFNHNIKENMTKAMKEIGVFKRLSKMLPWNSLFIICKSFVRHHLEYRDILYDQPNNKCLCKKMRLFNTMLVWPLTVPSKAHLKLNNELGLESFEFRRWFRKLCLFYKIKKNGLPEYLFNMIPQSNHQQALIYTFYTSANWTLPLFEIYAKFYFNTKHLEKGLNRGC